MLEKIFVIRPIKEIERYKCPFYGFDRRGSVFVDNSSVEDNQCGFLDMKNVSCEMYKKNPDFNKCRLNNKENFYELIKIKIFSKVYLRDMVPENTDCSKGVMFLRFFNYVMNLKEVKKD
jgi:hypothetical protein